MNNLRLWFIYLLCLVLLFTMLVTLPTYIVNIKPILTKEQLEDIKTDFENSQRFKNEQEQF
jgi:hypothetical protein